MAATRSRRQDLSARQPTLIERRREVARLRALAARADDRLGPLTLERLRQELYGTEGERQPSKRDVA